MSERESPASALQRLAGELLRATSPAAIGALVATTAADLLGADAAAVFAWAGATTLEALHTSGLTALVGREEEIELLLRRWSKAKTGEGQVVLLSGEAGIGKSRLTASLMERLASEPHTRLRQRSRGRLIAPRT